MSSRPMMGIALLVALLIGFLAGRFMPGAGEVRAGTPEAMATAMRSAFTEKDPMLRARDMGRLMDQLDAENLPGAIEVFREFSPKAESLGVSDFFAHWSRIDVDGLVLAMRTWPDEKASAQGAGWAVYQYALEGGTAKAIPYYDTLTPVLRMVSGYRLVEGALNGGDDVGLIQWVGALDDAEERSRLTQSIILKLLRERTPESAIALFDSVPADASNSYKRQFFQILLDKLMRQDVDAALAFRDARAGEPFAENSLNRLASAWADVDPAAAMAWIEAQPAGPEREHALETLVDRWAAHDHAAAVEWTRKQIPSPMIDRLSRGFVASLTIQDPMLAMELAGRIVDPEIRSAALRDFARYWFVRNPGEIHAWLERGGLSEREANALIQELNTTRKGRVDRMKPTPARPGELDAEG